MLYSFLLCYIIFNFGSTIKLSFVLYENFGKNTKRAIIWIVEAFKTMPTKGIKVITKISPYQNSTLTEAHKKVSNMTSYATDQSPHKIFHK